MLTHTVLIVDDNPTLAHCTARNLEMGIPNLRAFTAGSVQEARTLVEQVCPAVIVADVKLSDGSGIDLIREIARLHPHVTAILISGEPLPEHLDVTLFGFLLKPYEAEAIVDMVRAALVDLNSSLESWPKRSVIACEGYDRHQLQNHLATLLLSLRVVGGDLRAAAHDPAEVVRILDEHLDSLCASIIEVSQMLPLCRLRPSPDETWPSLPVRE